MTDQQRMEEGRRMFQIFAAKMFEQRVLAAYREKVAQERQKRFLEELEEEDRQREIRDKAKQQTKEKKKAQKKAQQQKREEERAELERLKREQEDKLKREKEERRRIQRQAEQAKREEALRIQREAEEKARREAEEKARKEAQEKARREAEERIRREAAEKAQRELEQIAQRAEEQRKLQEQKEQEEQQRKQRQREDRERAKREKDERRNKARKEQAASKALVASPVTASLSHPSPASPRAGSAASGQSNSNATSAAPAPQPRTLAVKVPQQALPQHHQSPAQQHPASASSTSTLQPQPATPHDAGPSLAPLASMLHDRVSADSQPPPPTAATVVTAALPEDQHASMRVQDGSSSLPLHLMWNGRPVVSPTSTLESQAQPLFQNMVFGPSGAPYVSQAALPLQPRFDPISASHSLRGHFEPTANSAAAANAATVADDPLLSPGSLSMAAATAPTAHLGTHPSVQHHPLSIGHSWVSSQSPGHRSITPRGQAGVGQGLADIPREDSFASNLGSGPGAFRDVLDLDLVFNLEQLSLGKQTGRPHPIQRPPGMTSQALAGGSQGFRSTSGAHPTSNATSPSNGLASNITVTDRQQGNGVEYDKDLGWGSHAAASLPTSDTLGLGLGLGVKTAFTPNTTDWPIFEHTRGQHAFSAAYDDTELFNAEERLNNIWHPPPSRTQPLAGVSSSLPSSSLVAPPGFRTDAHGHAGLGAAGTSNLLSSIGLGSSSGRAGAAASGIESALSLSLASADTLGDVMFGGQSSGFEASQSNAARHGLNSNIWSPASVVIPTDGD
ncbi:hypothetical protein BC831DRAFT_436454 [Entophlyctis helioformis]|nr:hypothetical protein BC831DRAFT_436454 [Entophlyctis helioformis]